MAKSLNFSRAIITSLEDHQDSELDQISSRCLAKLVGSSWTILEFLRTSSSSLKLSLISQELQIFSVTHSPQVAAIAHHHYLIEKKQKNGDSESGIIISELDSNQRTEEIARMLSGESITDQAREAAKSLQDNDEWCQNRTITLM